MELNEVCFEGPGLHQSGQTCFGIFRVLPFHLHHASA